MQNSSKTRTWANDDDMVKPSAEPAPAIYEPTQDNDTAEEASSQPKKARTQEPAVVRNDDPQPMVVDRSGEDEKEETSGQDDGKESETEAAPVSDMDWLRSKTSRLLGLLDEEEQAEFDQKKVDEPAKSQSPIADESRNAAIEKIPSQPPTNDEEDDGDDAAAETTPEQNANIDLIRASARLFARNLSYEMTEADLQPLFAPFGKLEEVSSRFFFISHRPLNLPANALRMLESARMMNILIGTSDAKANDVTRTRDFSRCFLVI